VLLLPGPDGSAVTSEQSPVKIRNATQAVDAVLSCLREQKVPAIPDADTKWHQKTIIITGREVSGLTALFGKKWLLENCPYRRLGR